MSIFFADVHNQEGFVVYKLILVSNEGRFFSIENRCGTNIMQLRKDSEAIFNISECFCFKSMKEVLSAYGNDTVSGTNSFYALINLIRGLYNEKNKWIWKSMNQGERDEFYAFFSPVYDESDEFVTYEQFRKTWNMITPNFEFLKYIKNGNNKIVRMLESTPDGSFKKGHFYMCERMDCHNALLVGEFNVRSIVSLNLIENGDKLFEQGNTL